MAELRWGAFVHLELREPPALTRSPRVLAPTRQEPHHCCRGAGAGSGSHYWSFRCWLPGLQQGPKTQEMRREVSVSESTNFKATFPIWDPSPPIP